MGSFHDQLVEARRLDLTNPEPEAEQQPFAECPRCSALVPVTSIDRHADWHQRTDT